MFGEDDYVTSLHRLCADLGIVDVVDFRGFQSDVWGELAALDILVHASVTPEPFGQVVIEGNPTDGWTLVSWEGHEVSATPDLLTGLFVDSRDLNVAPQIATWHVLEALQGGDPDQIAAALEAGCDQVLGALAAFPQAVFDTISGALSG